MRNDSIEIKRGFQEVNEIVQLYESGLSSAKIAELKNLSCSGLIKILRRNKVKIRDRAYKYINYADYDYFSNINTPNKAYVLGFIVADGCNYKGLHIGLQKRDKEVLEFITKELKYKGRIYEDEKYVKLVIKSKKISEDLSKLGVIPRKSHFTYFPDIPEELWNHFIRGVFDGDGCIHIEKNKVKTFNIIGNITLIERIQDILVDKCNLQKIKLGHSKRHPENIVSVTYRGNQQIDRIYEYLYKEASFALSRKEEKFKQKLDIRDYTLERHHLKCQSCNKLFDVPQCRNNSKFCSYACKSLAMIGQPSKLKKPIIQKDISGNIVCEYESLEQASMLTGINKKQISKSALYPPNNPRNFIWQYKEST